MLRPIVLGNGEMHVGINNYGLVHDLYYPYVGLENHAGEGVLRHRIGVWIDGTLSWLDDDSWDIKLSYPHSALIGHINAHHEKLNVTLEFDDAVDSENSLFMRNIHVINLSDEQREIRLFLHQAFIIGDSRSNTDTAQYLPDSNAILHYRGRRAFMVSAKCDNQYFDQHTIGVFGIENHEGTWRDAEDGELERCDVEHGRVDSTLRFKLNIAGRESKRVHYWLSAGTSTRTALFVFNKAEKDGIDNLFAKTQEWWQQWLAPALAVVDKIETEHQHLFLTSLMIMKSHIDKRGAIMASMDSSILQRWRDDYAYCWPRDGAYVVWPLIRLGYYDEPYRFFDFCRRSLHPSGYLMHKYRADGAIGSSWHPYVHTDNTVGPPIQEDETALTLFVFLQFYQQNPSPKLLKEFYENFVVVMADFLASYVDRRTNLPKPSYDLWEEQYYTSTYTTSVVLAALQSAAELADSIGDSARAVNWRSVGSDMLTAARKRLYSSTRKSLLRGLNPTEGGKPTKNTTADMSSFFGAFMFGLYDANGSELSSSLNNIFKKFDCQTAEYGLPRYENDNYLRDNQQGISNRWLITTLWAAQYYLEIGKRTEAMNVLTWVADQALPSGVFSEQIDPVTGQPLSVAPLVWSHAEYVATLLDTLTGSK